MNQRQFNLISKTKMKTMVTEICIVAVSLFLLVSGVSSQSTTFDVTTYGAKTDGSDSSQALAKAWTAACASPSASTIVIPKGTFALSKALFKGPCTSPINIQLQGTLQAPADPSQTNFEVWVSFQYLNQLTISGGGTFDGQGSEAWKRNSCSKDPHCPFLAYNLGFYFVNNSVIHDVTTLNSKSFHVNVFGCFNIQFNSFTITAPGDSPNTDGIHIAKSNTVNVTNSIIQTGDDCISIGDGAEQVGITGVTCGPGHGFSVGSLGKYNNEVPVVGIYVKNCTLINTMTGIRIKSWPNSYVGMVSDFHAEDIIMQNVNNPVLIDQRYCPWNQCTLQVASKVKITKASFKNIRGTSQTPDIIMLDCSSSYPCENVEIGDIDLAYSGPNGPARSACSNVKPIVSGTQNPPLCTDIVKEPMALRGTTHISS